MLQIGYIWLTLINIAAVSSQEPVPPDIWGCSPQAFSLPNKYLACETAYRRIPSGSQKMQFTSYAVLNRRPNWIELPLRYVDDDTNPTCTISINHHGHSLDDAHVPLSYNDLSSMVLSLIQHCVLRSNHGGVRTYGVEYVVYTLATRPVTYVGRFPYEPTDRHASGGISTPSPSL